MSAYLSARGLEQLRRLLADRDISVLRSVAEHRFLTAHHVEQLHFSSHASGESGARVCRRVLARLTRDRLLVRLDRRVGGVRAGSASFVYTLGPVGRRIIDNHRSRTTEPSALFLDHTLAIADLHCTLIAAARAGQTELVRVDVEPHCWRRYTGTGGAAEIVRPDLYAITATADYEDCWFIEVDRATESPAAIARKCRAYTAYWRTGKEQHHAGAFPLVVWIAPHEARVLRIRQVVESGRNINRDLFRTTTAENLLDLIRGGSS